MLPCLSHHQSASLSYCRELGLSWLLGILCWWLTCGWGMGCCADNCADAWSPSWILVKSPPSQQLLLRTPSLFWHLASSETAGPSWRAGMCWQLSQHHRAGRGSCEAALTSPPARCAGASSSRVLC